MMTSTKKMRSPTGVVSVEGRRQDVGIAIIDSGIYAGHEPSEDATENRALSTAKLTGETAR